MGTILYAVRNLKSCVIQVQNMHPSGASDQDIMEKANKLLMQDPKLKRDFKFDHVWLLMKDIPKFSDNVNIGIPDIDSDTVGSPASQSPGISSFSINLSTNDGGSNSSQRPIGSKKEKLKRKLSEGVEQISIRRIRSERFGIEKEVWEGDPSELITRSARIGMVPWVYLLRRISLDRESDCLAVSPLEVQFEGMADKGSSGRVEETQVFI
ncbi:Uncharacterized protein Rs2_21536 [Raphanus sativus]|nr:Uncharacterized protein Rs2_21536 [Raphanus sativus]